MTENPHDHWNAESKGVTCAHCAYNEGHAAGDIAGFNRGVRQMIKYIEENPGGTIKDFFNHFEELIDYEP